MRKILILTVFIVLALGVSFYGHAQNRKAPVSKPVQSPVVNQGIWITVFSKEKILYSKEAIAKLIAYCKKNNIKEIYLQVFRAGQPYYDSQILKSDEYQRMTKSMGEDPIEYLLSQTHANGLKVHAWINVLSLAQNKDAAIIKKYDQLVLTRDKNQRSSIRTEEINDSDKFYLRDDQLFLEPGDERVVDFTLEVIEDLMARYPAFDGLHLDYIRYPYPVPFIPDSRFLDTGISYGFGDKSVARFKETYGLDALKDDLFPQDLYLKWDQWKRDQVTNLVRKISSLVKEKSKTWKLSCAVVPTMERAYSVAYQDWAQWLDENIVDYVVLMSYTRDARFYSQIIKAAMALHKPDQVYIGLGVFLFKSNEEFNLNYSIVKNLNPSGIVFFAYDELLEKGLSN